MWVKEQMRQTAIQNLSKCELTLSSLKLITTVLDPGPVVRAWSCRNTCVWSCNAQASFYCHGNGLLRVRPKAPARLCRRGMRKSLPRRGYTITSLTSSWVIICNRPVMFLCLISCSLSLLSPGHCWLCSPTPSACPFWVFSEQLGCPLVLALRTFKRLGHCSQCKTAASSQPQRFLLTLLIAQ